MASKGKQMLSSDERVQLRNFQNRLVDLIDFYLIEGADPNDLKEIMREECGKDFFARRHQLEEDK
jgi:hypothetical protein